MLSGLKCEEVREPLPSTLLMVSLTQLRPLTASLTKCSQKTGFGPYRLHRKGQHFVGTEPDPLKYHLLQNKKPEHPYGLQGTNHLLPGKGKIASRLPTKVLMKKDKIYAWCSCGYSASQPLCDGSHNLVYIPDLKLRPVRFIPDRDTEVWLCNCKQTGKRPFCDGSHSQIKDVDKKAGLFD
ncbi:CDGSH iron-sulfur domain-containing protein 3, mitochondrial [Toxocara canis]|uniref:CDGSH iron-sulfur domain-containing protein 3, mitochondrial n=1 Tax=Toxocara canis TaxID=6265 RepID=A0A0B2VEP5_TOXCA|nr:CDGSH iron-sulfur domain-containing protein 3, mitochondrial [Toxocara canis]